MNSRSNMPAIEFEQVIKHYGDKTVVNGLSFDVLPGECFGLLGPNGAGKTTTLRMLLGIVSPDAGRISLCGEPVPTRARATTTSKRRTSSPTRDRSMTAARSLRRRPR